jgi:hypothetical protein
MMRMDEESPTREAIKSKGVKPLADMHPVTAIARGGMLREFFGLLEVFVKLWRPTILLTAIFLAFLGKRESL